MNRSQRCLMSLGMWVPERYTDHALDSDAFFQLLEACCQVSPVDVDADIYIHLINASFSGVSGRGKSPLRISISFAHGYA